MTYFKTYETVNVDQIVQKCIDVLKTPDLIDSIQYNEAAKYFRFILDFKKDFLPNFKEIQEFGDFTAENNFAKDVFYDGLHRFFQKCPKDDKGWPKIDESLANLNMTELFEEIRFRFFQIHLFHEQLFPDFFINENQGIRLKDGFLDHEKSRNRRMP